MVWRKDHKAGTNADIRLSNTQSTKAKTENPWVEQHLERKKRCFVRVIYPIVKQIKYPSHLQSVQLNRIVKYQSNHPDKSVTDFPITPVPTIFYWWLHTPGVPPTHTSDDPIRDEIMPLKFMAGIKSKASNI
mgnify:CR=1 FL=1